MIVGSKIARLRKNSKFSQPELAYKLEISQTALSDIESGKTKKIDFVMTNKICQIFDVDFDYFLEEDKTVFTFDKIEKNKGGNIGCKIDVINNNLNEGLLENLIKRVELLELKFNN